MRRLLSTPLTLLLMVEGLVSCHHFNEPRYPVEDRVILPIPFRDLTAPRNRRWYGETERGIRLARSFRAWAESESVGNFLDGPDAERLTRAVTTGWLEDTIREKDWREISAGVDVDLILIGEIIEFTHKQPGDIGFYRGSAQIEYQLIHPRSGRAVYRTPSPREVKFPDPESTDLPFYDLDASKNVEKIEYGLIRKLGEQLGRDLYGYYSN